eukprot:Hpha_TRINITY_DN14990_c0_g1::TRINITY_DN14990_c0_g1_i1::g.142959::m.142959
MTRKEPIALLNKPDYFDKLLKMTQSILKIKLFFLATEATTKAKIGVFMNQSTTWRRLLSLLKWTYQIQVILDFIRGKAKLNVKLVQQMLTTWEQLSSDASYLESINLVGWDAKRLGWHFSFSKAWANVCLLVMDAKTLQQEQKAVAQGKGSADKLFRLRIAVVREMCDIATYMAGWSEKLALSPTALQVAGMLSSCIGLYEMETS